MTWLNTAVPVAAILISTGLAVGLARAERKAAKQERLEAAAGDAIQALGQVASASIVNILGDPAVLPPAVFAWDSSITRLKLLVPHRDRAVIVYAQIVFSKAIDTSDPGVITNTSGLLTGALEGWIDGKISVDRFTRIVDNGGWELPPTAPELWEKIVMRPSPVPPRETQQPHTSDPAQPVA